MNLRAWTTPCVSAPAVAAPVDDLARLREENAHLRIRLAAVETAAAHWQRIHEESNRNWARCYLTLQATVLDLQHAIVLDRDSPEDRHLAGAVVQ